MDPNTLLHEINDCLVSVEQHNDKDADERVDESCRELFEWLDKGGFEPEWSKYPQASSYYRCRVIMMRREARG